MGASARNRSPKPTNVIKAVDAESTGQQWDPGPDLEPLSSAQRRKFVRDYALQHHRNQILVMVLAILLLGIGACIWNELHPPIIFNNSTSMPSASPSNWADWLIRIQAFLGLPTLLVALFVWIGEIREDWENDLPKRMSVFFLHKSRPVIVCRYVWLAGEGDMRAWGQQVAAQAANERFLNFYPNVKALDPELAIWIDGKICRHYVVCFELTDRNSFLARYLGMSLYQNMATGSNIVFSVPLADLQEKVSASIFPFDWRYGQAVNQTQSILQRYLPRND